MRQNARRSSPSPEHDLETALQAASSRVSSCDTDPWPLRVPPLPDELLSSWLVRIAMAHGVKVHTLCRLTWLTKAVWNRDIDKLADEEFVQVLGRKTNISFSNAHATTMSAYEGYLFENLNRFGPTSWILPVGIYHRVRQRFGQQFCSLCLREDKEPYYRRRWRLAFMTCCEVHAVALLDRCPQCGSAVNFHRNELGDPNVSHAVSITHCFKCALNFSDPTICSFAKPVAEPLVTFTRSLLTGLEIGFVRVGYKVSVYSHLFFAGLRQLMRVLATSHSRLENLRGELQVRFDLGAKNGTSTANLEELNVGQRNQLLNGARILLLDWPKNFVELSTKHLVWSSFWLKHLETINPRWGRSQKVAPFWYWSVVNNHLKRERYMPTELEIGAAIRYLGKTTTNPNKKMLAKFFGEAVAYNRTPKLRH
jgi:hypothetical protein